MKTGFFKKAAAVFMAGAMAVSLAGCADDSWSAKDDTQTLARGFTFITFTALTRRPSPG